ncbi:MAG: prepilin-type N-terminal cleavage/methylation domain-containing protein [candidate division WOR-3 bacterium]|nr:prepilin-type N-terminal cleavage/methylation domain-containing protein [candidate division WOR-3 bacterium]MCX7757639.1 prepilin-type N-terminal cleavage/methylation domain-containing protein [candidate division WOR-3 bacterium]MDW7987453.1 prepilin-type N-terminal cleavage/methylation domain-containing protein [candidate division WOR-3 bacterium]
MRNLIKNALNSNERGVTLVELIVVVLIIGIIGAVALRTIDATSYQAKFEKTKKEMFEIVKAIVGNPDIISEGRRINFGYVGDMGRLPSTIKALITNEGGNWKGPYFTGRFLEDTLGLLLDEWGRPYHYNPESLIISSSGGGKQSLTLKIADTITDLLANEVLGTVIDITGAPPANHADRILIKLTVPRDGILVDYVITPRSDGYFAFRSPEYPVPIGYHRIIAYKQYGFPESIVKWISVTPRSKIIVDFKFPSSFHSNLKYVVASGVAYGHPQPNNVGFRIFNAGDTALLESMTLIYLDTTAFYEAIEYEGNNIWQCPHAPIDRAKIGEEIRFTTPVYILPNAVVRFDLKDFKDDEYAHPGHDVGLRNRRFVIRFSDGSVIDFQL